MIEVYKNNTSPNMNKIITRHSYSFFHLHAAYCCFYRFNKETESRSHKDDTYNKLGEENRLKSEITELVKVTNGKEEMINKLKQEVTAAKSESDRLKKEKDNLMIDFTDESNRDKEKVIKLRQECEELFTKYEKKTDAQSLMNDINEKLKTENENLRRDKNAAEAELIQLKEKEDMAKKMKQELTTAKAEHEKLNKEKEEKIRLCQNEYVQFKEKCNKLERQIEELNIRHEKERETNTYNEDTYNKLREENNRLRKERNLEKTKVLELTKEKEEMSRKLKQEVTAAKSENDKLKKENDNLKTDFKKESYRDTEKISKLRQEYKELFDKYSSEKKMHQHNAYKLMQLQNDIKICKHEKAQLEKALKDQKEDNIELENKFRDLELNRSRCKQCDEYEKTMAKLKKEKQELQDKCKSKDDLLQKADKENRHLKGGIDQLKSNIIEHKQEIETLNNRMEILREEKLEFETITRSRSPQVTSETKQCQNCWKYKNDISELKKEVNSLRDRLSEAAGNKLRDNNPNIADLSDMNRPTSLAEKFSTLYTDEYTDAMEVIETDMNEEECAGTMLQWLKICYDWCEQLAKEQRDLLTENSTGFMKKYLGHGENFVISARCLIHVKEFQKKIAVDSLIAVGKICHIKSLNEKKLLNDNHISKYIKKCSELCWMMQITDPPLCLKFDVKHGESLDRNSYNVFTKSGSKVDFLVWPILYLHKTGPLLAKGVAQGM